MASFNKVILVGNLTRDPERRYTPKGTAVTEFGIAINRVYNTEAGEKKEEVHFFDIYTMGRQAETCAQYLSKGRPVLVEGRLQQDRWKDKETGKERSRVRIFAETVQFLGSRPQGQEFREESGPESQTSPSRQAGGRSQGPPPAAAEEEPPAAAGGKEKDDIPF